jgi:tetratricopeptide (TPR) repeat protein
MLFTSCNIFSNDSVSLANDTTLSLEAREWSKKIDQTPDNAEYYVLRAEVLVNEKKYELAIKDYQKAIELKPEVVSHYYKLGDVLFAADKTTLALEQYVKAEEVNPKDQEAIFKHAQFLYFVRQFDKSKIKFGKLKFSFLYIEISLFNLLAQSLDTIIIYNNI